MICCNLFRQSLLCSGLIPTKFSYWSFLPGPSWRLAQPELPRGLAALIPVYHKSDPESYSHHGRWAAIVSRPLKLNRDSVLGCESPPNLFIPRRCLLIKLHFLLISWYPSMISTNCFCLGSLCSPSWYRLCGDGHVFSQWLSIDLGGMGHCIKLN